MLETIVNTPEAPITELVKPVVTPVATPSSAPEQDIMTKVANFKKSAPTVVPEKTADTLEEAFDYKEIDKIQDPVAKEIFWKGYKSMQRTVTKKTQEAADKIKDFEQKLQQMQSWSPDRIQKELLSNPQFLQAAQQIAMDQNPPNSGLTDQEFSALTETEKNELTSLKNQVNELKNSNQQTALRAEVAQTDASLQTKYADYNPTDINTASQNLANMNLSSVREYVYKATLHDKHVQDAYELGRQESRQLTQEKIGAISPDGTLANANDSPPTKNKGERDEAYIVRLALNRLAQQRRK